MYKKLDPTHLQNMVTFKMFPNCPKPNIWKEKRNDNTFFLKFFEDTKNFGERESG